MFTGIVEATGTVVAVEHDATSPGGGSARVTLRCDVVGDAPHGASIAVDGVCLTVADEAGAVAGRFSVDVMGETLRCSTFGGLAVGDVVHIERAVEAGGRLDGHIVQGHVDAVADVVAVEQFEAWREVRFQVPAELAPYLVLKGSVTVAGVSLTVSGVSDPAAESVWFSVGLIPTTCEVTRLGEVTVGDQVNVEVDVLGKYVERIVAVRAAAGDQVVG